MVVPSSEDIAHEREVLEDLLRSEGWRVFVRHVANEWKGTGYYTRMNTVLKSPKPEEAILVHQCSEAIITAVMWPDRRIAELTEAKK